MWHDDKKGPKHATLLTTELWLMLMTIIKVITIAMIQFSSVIFFSMAISRRCSWIFEISFNLRLNNDN